jgi:phosphatidylethanolamine-binding protein (PEBP) family uncharacterized protein
MSSSRAVAAALYGGVFATLANAQASLDYAARSVGSVLANGPGDIYVGACPVNGSVVNCVHQYYPTVFNASLVGILFGVAFLLVPKNKF